MMNRFRKSVMQKRLIKRKEGKQMKYLLLGFNDNDREFTVNVYESKEEAINAMCDAMVSTAGYESVSETLNNLGEDAGITEDKQQAWLTNIEGINYDWKISTEN